MKLTLGFSPCPNDTFIFDAMIHHKIDTEGLDFEVYMGDVEDLNQKALRGVLDITKLSYHAFAYLLDKYVLLDAGSALGNNCGPLLIAKQHISDADLASQRVAIPGKYTTANFLLSLAFPQITNKIETIFSDIEQDVLSEKVGAGLIIHENRFTYAAKGLVKIIDCGEFWEQTTGFPIPLGGIVIRRNMDLETQQKVNRVLRRSVEFAFANPSSSMPYTRLHAQEMSDDVMQQHIKLYVNDFSIDLGTRGRAAVEHLFSVAHEKAIVPKFEESIFLD
jgi:1,4-dihydroxy-6-naphthoate synthase